MGLDMYRIMTCHTIPSKTKITKNLKKFKQKTFSFSNFWPILKFDNQYFIIKEMGKGGRRRGRDRRRERGRRGEGQEEGEVEEGRGRGGGNGGG